MMYDHLPEMVMSDDQAYRAMIAGQPHNAAVPVFDKLRGQWKHGMRSRKWIALRRAVNEMMRGTQVRPDGKSPRRPRPCSGQLRRPKPMHHQTRP
jgi:hypothetical protein